MDNGYTYDVNGNMTKDLNKGITNISYNHLNLPTRVTIGGKNIDYTYDAGGVKLSKTVSGVATQYAGNYVYENGVLQFFNHPEGYVSPKNASDISQGFKYVYQYKDHLGNVRLSYTDNNNDGVITPSTEIIEESNYYPFGLKHKGYNNVVNSLGNSTGQKYMFNQGTSGKNFKGEEGKSFRVERQEELGLNVDMTKFRMYDYALGRFTSIDPLADANPQESWTPYQYAYNSPIQYNDPYGDCPWCVWGAVIGGGLEYASQVVSNYSGGQSLTESLTNVDGGKIAVATIAGAATGGIGSIATIGKTAKVVKVIAVTSTTVIGSMMKQNMGKDSTGKLDVSSLGVDAAMSVVKLPKVKLPRVKVKGAKVKVNKAEAVRKGTPGRQKAIKKAKRTLRKMENKNTNTAVKEKVINSVIKKVVKTKIKQKLKQ
ncbi:RHS repeat domain-containing protein [Tenacibaculum maritimum]|uniref:RHS repeat domain-containing protein n=1 Tax=Tenacibaculum maritimum TaxID=107401 RepID=UPI00388F5803